jgi:hypothetical protein
MTGRGMGWCGGANAAIDMPQRGPGFGMGRGGGRGGGWRHRHWYYATGLPGWQRAWMGWPGPSAAFPGAFPPALSKEEELAALKQQATNVEQALGELKIRIQELEKAEAGATSSSGKEER